MIARSLVRAHQLFERGRLHYTVRILRQKRFKSADLGIVILLLKCRDICVIFGRVFDRRRLIRWICPTCSRWILRRRRSLRTRRYGIRKQNRQNSSFHSIAPRALRDSKIFQDTGRRRARIQDVDGFSAVRSRDTAGNTWHLFRPPRQKLPSGERDYMDALQVKQVYWLQRVLLILMLKCTGVIVFAS